jgi:AmiR/NasT family two-component response regulator
MSARVVIAEDEAIIRLDLKEILEEEGYDVVGEVGRGDEVIQKVEDEKPDVVILDIKMPGRDGLSVAQDITEQRLAAVLILTAFSQRNLVDQAVEAGALQYLVKPFQKAELAPAIEVALGRFRQIQELESSNRTLEDQLETRKLVDRAKDLLMDQHHMAANDAFSFIQRTAMRERLTMKATAQRILDGGLAPPATGETPAV